MRERLHQADSLLRQGLLAEAVALYELVASEFEATGFAVKEIAVSRQIVDVVQERPELVADGNAALQRLSRLYAQLGLNSDAAEAERVRQASARDRLH